MSDQNPHSSCCSVGPVPGWLRKSPGRTLLLYHPIARPIYMWIFCCAKPIQLFSWSGSRLTLKVTSMSGFGNLFHNDFGNRFNKLVGEHFPDWLGESLWRVDWEFPNGKPFLKDFGNQSLLLLFLLGEGGLRICFSGWELYFTLRNLILWVENIPTILKVYSIAMIER